MKIEDIFPIGLGSCVYRSEDGTGVILRRDQRLRTIRYALDRGINYIDTAPLYGSKAGDGDSEDIIGEALSEIPPADTYVTTKSQNAWTTDAQENLDNLRASFERSLEKLQRSYLNGYLLHDIPVLLEAPDAVFPCIDEIQRYKADGLINEVGVGTVDINIVKAVLDQGWADIIQLGGGTHNYPYSDLRKSHPDIVEAIKAQGVYFMDCQLFSGLVNKPELKTPTYHKEAIQYSLDSDFVHVSVVGMHTEDEIDSNMSAYETHSV